MIVPRFGQALQPEEFRLIKEFVADSFGIVLDDSRERNLSAMLGHRLKELNLESAAAYYSYLKFSASGSEELRFFISLITNNETYFFREAQQLRIFAEEALPALKELKSAAGQRRIRILSVGCSSGEEVYTLAMLLIESGLFLWDWDLQVVGLDLDETVLEKAKAGLYGGRAFQTTPARFRERYFRKTADRFEVKEVLRRITAFVRGNLLQIGETVAESSVDMVFCRNVLIYFNDATIRSAVEGFARIMTPDGLLFLGHSESLARITSQYVPLRFPGGVIYRVREPYDHGQ